MPSTLKIDPTHIQIFHEGRKRRVFVGDLWHDPKEDHYALVYDKQYLDWRQAIPLGPELSLLKAKHISQKGRLFPSFLDRIPLKENPAYVDYCRARHISVDEENKIILLGAIARRGPSTFIFEPVYTDGFSIKSVTDLREQLEITQHDFAEAFGINKLTLHNLESGKSRDPNTLKILQIYFAFPEVALWQLKQTGPTIHYRAAEKLVSYFKSQ